MVTAQPIRALWHIGWFQLCFGNASDARKLSTLSDCDRLNCAKPQADSRNCDRQSDCLNRCGTVVTACARLAATPQARRRFDRARLIVEGLFTSSACARQQAVLDHDYAFFAGDLNYRIELDRQVIESRIFDRSLGTLRLYPCVLRRLSKAGGTPFYFQWLCVAADSLLSADQLLQQQARGSCFVGWLESPIRFIPTCVLT